MLLKNQNQNKLYKTYTDFFAIFMSKLKFYIDFFELYLKSYQTCFKLVFGKCVAVKRTISTLRAALIPEKSKVDDHGYVPLVEVLSTGLQLDSSPV